MTGRLTVPLLAVDGGGTKCAAVFAAADGSWLSQGGAGSCNYQGVGREAATLELVRAIRAAKAGLAATGIATAGRTSACSSTGIAGASEAAGSLRTGSAGGAGIVGRHGLGLGLGAELMPEFNPKQDLMHDLDPKLNPEPEPMHELDPKRSLVPEPTVGLGPKLSPGPEPVLELKQQPEPLLELECALFALAGVDTQADYIIARAMAEEALRQAGITAHRVVVENDGFCALVGATGGQPGILVISGTGSIVYGTDGQEASARAGGWGHRVGDEGSGYWIGAQAIKAILKASDGRGEATLLGEWIFPHLGIGGAEDLFNWTYGQEYSVEKTGRLAPLVDAAAQAGDKISQHILEAAVKELFAASQAVIGKLRLREKQTPFAVILQGGVLRHCNYVRDQLYRSLRAYCPGARLHTSVGEPIQGVVGMGVSLLDTSGKNEISKIGTALLD